MLPRFIPLALLSVAVSGCGVARDDTTAATRQIASSLLGVNYSDVKPTATLSDLGCDDLDVVELIMEMEEAFDISITEADLESLNAPKGLGSVTILELANLARSNRN
jgi:acyl carrier protein